MSPEDVNFLTLLTKFLSIHQGLRPLAGMTSTVPLFSMSSGNFSLRLPDNSSCPKVLFAQSHVLRCHKGTPCSFLEHFIFSSAFPPTNSSYLSFSPKTFLLSSGDCQCVSEPAPGPTSHHCLYAKAK